MTSAENTELKRLNDALFGNGLSDPGLIVKVDQIDQKLDRLDGALTFIKAAASFLGIGGLSLLLAAVARSS